MPDKIMLLGLVENGWMLDGKDSVTKTVCKDDPIRQRQNSSKMHLSAVCWLNFITNCGLSFELSHAYLAHVEETVLVELMGSYQNEKAPVDQWKDYARNDTRKQKPLA
jgi:hypothetical protein